MITKQITLKDSHEIKRYFMTRIKCYNMNAVTYAGIALMVSKFNCNGQVVENPVAGTIILFTITYLIIYTAKVANVYMKDKYQYSI